MRREVIGKLSTGCRVVACVRCQDRFRQPLSDVSLTSHACRAQEVDPEPGSAGADERLRGPSKIATTRALSTTSTQAGAPAMASNSVGTDVPFEGIVNAATQLIHPLDLLLE